MKRSKVVKKNKRNKKDKKISFKTWVKIVLIGLVVFICIAGIIIWLLGQMNHQEGKSVATKESMNING